MAPTSRCSVPRRTTAPTSTLPPWDRSTWTRRRQAWPARRRRHLTPTVGTTRPTSATFGGVHLDRTAPSTDFSAPSAWKNAAVTINFTATDNLSGVAATHYTVDGGVMQTGDSLTLSTEGIYDIEVWSVDNAGNL